MPLHDPPFMLVLRCSVVLAPLALIACGPSLKAAVESDMRFEHCYRIDDDPSTSVMAKRGCWSEWSARYTRGQARERLNYAHSRIKVLDGALATAPPPNASPSAAVACPPPSTPYAPPPAVVPKGEAVTGTASACSDTCTTAWRTCSTPCSAAAACVLACDDKFRLCVKACL